MACDEGLAELIGQLVKRRKGFDQRKMFGRVGT